MFTSPGPYFPDGLPALSYRAVPLDAGSRTPLLPGCIESGIFTMLLLVKPSLTSVGFKDLCHTAHLTHDHPLMPSEPYTTP